MKLNFSRITKLFKSRIFPLIVVLILLTAVLFCSISFPNSKLSLLLAKAINNFLLIGPEMLPLPPSPPSPPPPSYDEVVSGLIKNPSFEKYTGIVSSGPGASYLFEDWEENGPWEYVAVTGEFEKNIAVSADDIAVKRGIKMGGCKEWGSYYQCPPPQMPEAMITEFNGVAARLKWKPGRQGGTISQTITIPDDPQYSGPYVLEFYARNASGDSKGFVEFGGQRKEIEGPLGLWLDYKIGIPNINAGSQITITFGVAGPEDADYERRYDFDVVRLKRGSLGQITPLTAGNGLLIEEDPENNPFDPPDIVLNDLTKQTSFTPDPEKYLSLAFFGPNIPGYESYSLIDPSGPGKFIRVKLELGGEEKPIEDYVFKLDSGETFLVPLGKQFQNNSYKVSFYTCQDESRIQEIINDLRINHPVFSNDEEGFFTADSLGLIPQEEEDTPSFEPLWSNCSVALADVEINLALPSGYVSQNPFPSEVMGAQEVKGAQSPELSVLGAQDEEDPEEFGSCTFKYNRNLLDGETEEHLPGAFRIVDSWNPPNLYYELPDPRDPTRTISVFDGSVFEDVRNTAAMQTLYQKAGDCSWQPVLGGIVLDYIYYKGAQKLKEITNYNPLYPAGLRDEPEVFSDFLNCQGNSDCQSLISDFCSSCCPGGGMPLVFTGPDAGGCMTKARAILDMMERIWLEKLSNDECKAVARGFLGYEPPHMSSICDRSAQISGLKERAKDVRLSFKRSEIPAGGIDPVLSDKIFFYYMLEKDGGGAYDNSKAYYNFKPFDPAVDGLNFRNFSSIEKAASLNVPPDVLRGACAGMVSLVQYFAHNAEFTPGQINCAEVYDIASRLTDLKVSGRAIVERNYARIRVPGNSLNEISKRCEEEVAARVSFEQVVLFNFGELKTFPSESRLTNVSLIKDIIDKLTKGKFVQTCVHFYFRKTGEIVGAHAILIYDVFLQSGPKDIIFLVYDPNRPNKYNYLRYSPSAHTASLRELSAHAIGNSIPVEVKKVRVSSDVVPRHQANCLCDVSKFCEPAALDTWDRDVPPRGGCQVWRGPWPF